MTYDSYVLGVYCEREIFHAHIGEPTESLQELLDKEVDDNVVIFGRKNDVDYRCVYRRLHGKWILI